MPVLRAQELLERYDAFFLDAYGVLVDGQGALPHAADFVRAIDAAGKQRLLVSNDASRTPMDVQERMRGLGIEFALSQLQTSGMLIAPWVQQRALAGCAAVVLGPEASVQMARDAGLRVVAPGDDAAEAVVVCDEAGFPFVEAIEATLSDVIRRIERALPVHLALPNPDIIYPKANGVGLTAGAAAVVIERALDARFPEQKIRFERLGKPHALIFEQALAKLPDTPRSRIVMLGDQMETDVAGARAMGLDVALVETGVGRRPSPSSALQPTWIVESLARGGSTDAPPRAS